MLLCGMGIVNVRMAKIQEMIRYFEIFYKNPHPFYGNSYVYGLTSLSNLLNHTHLYFYEAENRFMSRQEALEWYDKFYRIVDKDVKEYNEQHPDGPQRLNPLPLELYVIENYHLIIL
jgi:hypothetical protein